MAKVIKIDVVTKSVYHVELGNDYKEIYGQIGNGCTTFCSPLNFENEDFMFADDEALLRDSDIVGGFYMTHWNTPIIGNALIIGSDEEGNSVDSKTTIQEIQSQIKFIDAEECKKYADIALSIPPIVFSF
jgi:hypothetical protein